MFSGAEILVGVLGNLVYDISKRCVKDLVDDGEIDSYTNKMLAAVDRACKTFYDKYDNQFGKPEESFLAREANWDKIIMSLRYDHKKLETTDLIKEGFNSVAPATIEALTDLLDFIYKEANTDLELGKILAEKEHFVHAHNMDKKLDEALSRLPSYDNDAKTLLEHTRCNLQYMRHLAEMKVKDQIIKIDRVSTAALVDAAQAGSLIVVGDPGSGKSGAIYDLVSTLQHEGNDVVLVSVDRIDATNYGVLREELSLHNSVESVIDHWPGDKPCFLVLDALDAARADNANSTLRKLMESIARNERWKVIASIRRFDLRYSIGIRRLFKGTPPTDYTSAEFADVRHINIPLFSEEEISDVCSKCADLAAVIGNSNDYLKQIIRTPFNLRLVAELIGSDFSTDQWNLMKTQSDLLDQYWDYRVICAPGNADGREQLLQGVLTDMIKRRSLQVSRGVAAQINPTALLQILSSNILLEWEENGGTPNRYILAFSHNILFDYAVARVKFRGSKEDVLHSLEADPAAVVVLRPSLTHMFSYLWSSDTTRKRFWDFIFDMTANQVIPEVGKLIGPSIAVELSDHIADFQPLIDQILHGKDASEQFAKVLDHVIGAIVVKGEMNSSILVGNNAGPWCDLLENISIKNQRRALYSAYPLLMEACKRNTELNASQLKSIGIVARRLLDFAWSESVRNSGIVTQALRFVCQTYRSDLRASADLLRRALVPAHLSQYGYQEMMSIAWEIENLIHLDVNLVEEIYRTAFSFRDNKADTTDMGGRILQLSSNRRQDYETALYSFTEAYPSLLKEAPLAATRVVITAIDYYVEHEKKISSDATKDFFDFLGIRSEIIEDRSHSWDAAETYRHDDPIKLMDAFVGYVMALGDGSENIDLCQQILTVLAQENRYAVIWQKIIRCGNEKPDTWGILVRPLAWAIPVLTNWDTLQEIGTYLEKNFPRMSEAERCRVETAVLSITDFFVDDEERGKCFFKRLICRLNPEYILNQKIKDLLEEIKTKNGLIANIPLIRFSGPAYHPYSNEDRLTNQGVDFSKGRNRNFQDLNEVISEFAQKYLSETPDLVSIKAIMPTIRNIFEIISGDGSDIHPKLVVEGSAYLSATCACIARLSLDEKIDINDMKIVRDILLFSAQGVFPIYNPEGNESFDDSPSWGFPSTRISAACGLMHLVRNSEFYDENARLAVHALLSDEVLSVRYQIVQCLSLLNKVDLDLMWDAIRDRAENESSMAVLSGLISSLSNLWSDYPNEVAGITVNIFRRTNNGPGGKRLRKQCLETLLVIFIWECNKVCQDIIENIIHDPQNNVSDIKMIIPGLRDTMNISTPVLVVNRTWVLVRQIADNLGNTYDKSSENENEVKHELLRCMDNIGLQIFFASGAHEKAEHAEIIIDSDGKKQFLNFAEETIKLLIRYPIPSLIHHIVQMLKFLIEGDPRRVFILLGEVVDKSKQGLYHYESMGADLVVSIIERYLAEYRHVLKDSDSEKMLISILDTFVEAGWPQARRLTYRLEEIYR